MDPRSESFNDEQDSVEYRSVREDMRDFDQAMPLSPSDKGHNDQEFASHSFSMHFEMPPQLHPACSTGMRRVSSCYFSLASSNENQSISDVLVSQPGDKSYGVLGSSEGQNEANGNKNDPIHNSVDLFYHDILMQVFSFLDPNSLLCFSETARRPNFEVFYFLQLQLQQALLIDEDDKKSDIDHINRIPEKMENYSASIVSRVARSDMEKAREIVEEYEDSNSTLRTMPLSYSLAYVRHYLLHNGFHKMFSNDSNHNDTNECKRSDETQSSKMASSQTLASAAMFVTFVGAASLVSSPDSSIAMVTDRFGTELQNVLFRVGFVGSLMRVISETERGTAMREKAEQMARSMQELPAVLMPSRRNDEQQAQLQDGSTEQKESNEVEHEESERMNFVLPSLYEMRHMLQEMMSTMTAAEKREERQSLFFDPYAHPPSQQGANDASREEKKGSDHDDDNEQLTMTQLTEMVDFTTNTTSDGKVPSGCVGAYSRSIHKAADYVTSHIKAKRKAMFESLSIEDQRQRSLEFLSACASNETLNEVKAMVSVMDVDRFYIGNDGTETCALHTAAFNGAHKVVEFLCAGIDLQDSHLDGGLCDVNAKDNNGWTALHFAAGANSVEAVRVLAHNGAILNVEAHNGYSPLSWSRRLSNEAVAEELRGLISMLGTDQRGKWKPLASIANHFFSFIPSQ